MTGPTLATGSLEELWRRYTGVDPGPESNFLADGGDSFKVRSYILVCKMFQLGFCFLKQLIVNMGYIVCVCMLSNVLA